MRVYFSQKERRPYSGRSSPPLFGPSVHMHWGPPAEGREDPSFYKLLCEEKRGKRVRGEYFDEQEGAEKNLLTRKLRLESAANTVF